MIKYPEILRNNLRRKYYVFISIILLITLLFWLLIRYKVMPVDSIPLADGSFVLLFLVLFAMIWMLSFLVLRHYKNKHQKTESGIKAKRITSWHYSIQMGTWMIFYLLSLLGYIFSSKFVFLVFTLITIVKITFLKPSKHNFGH